MTPTWSPRRLLALNDAEIDGLANVLIDCVEGGASVSFMRPLRAAEATARECGKTLLVLDTASDDAERLFERVGWERVGVIPGYALLPQGGLCSTTVYYRNLGA
jgi:hypothetical protein